MRRILNNTKKVNELSVALKRTELKGMGLYADKPIKKGDTIAYYKLKVFDTRNYTSPTDFTYAFSIYTKDGELIQNLVGDIDFNSLDRPINNVPFWGMFINEPSADQVINVEVDYNLDLNYKSGSELNTGDTIVYRFIATTDIEEGDEILWYYGKNYYRGYEINELAINR